MKEYAFFIGCTSPVRALNYELSARKVAEIFDIKLVDIEDFACCGFPVKSMNTEAAFTMACRNLAIAEKNKQDIVTICNACTGFLKEASKKVNEDPELKKKINENLAPTGLKYNGTVEVTHFAKLLYNEIGKEKIKEKIINPLNKLDIAAHYGCHYIKPSKIFDEDVNFPHTLDELIEATGAKSIDYENKNLCCGGAILGIDENTAREMTKEKLDKIKGKADAMVLICPFCSIMYDANQRAVETQYNTEYKIPVLYYPQLLGLALGCDARELGMEMNRVRTNALLDKIKG